ncbi:MAG: hydroxymethylglutaryl-CoA lyase, partial [Planctomycetes bacterium]|nr:hydroxymethylglutaryl-CoA lyase [Planctomycetota bacterium]
LTQIEASAFVNPTWVPQLADADEVFAGISKNEHIQYWGLVPNLRGWHRASASGVDGIAVLAAASETFCQQNTNTSIDGALERMRPIVSQAASSGVGVRGYISCVIACPYEGEIELSKVRHITECMLEMGIQEISLGDTIGAAEPEDMRRLFDALDGLLQPKDAIVHLHDTHGKAIACVEEALLCGVAKFDASCGGLGGCPYAPGAAGNIATEDLVDFANKNGIETGIDILKLVAASKIIESALELPLESKTYRAFQDSQTPPRQ